MLAPLVASVADDVSRGVVKFFGFDQPRDLRSSLPTTSGVAKDFAASTGLSPASQLSRFPDSSPGAVFSSTVGDDMSIRDLAGLESLLLAFTLNSTTAPGTCIASWPVNPKAINPTFGIALNVTGGSSPGTARQATFTVPTNLSLVSTPFVRWRGTLSYTFRFCASAFHTARLRVFFVPGEDQGFVLPTTPAVDYWNRLIEVSGNTETTIEVPFLFPLPYAIQSIGRLVVQVVVPPAAVGDVPPQNSAIECLVVNKAMDDFEVVDASGTYWMDYAYTGWRDPEPPTDDEVAALSPESKLFDHPSVHVGGGPYTTGRFDHLTQLVRSPEIYCVDRGASNSGAVPYRVVVPPTYGYGPVGTIVNTQTDNPNEAYPVVFTDPSTHQPGVVTFSNVGQQVTRGIVPGTILQFYGFTALQAFSQYFWFWRGGIRYTAMAENSTAGAAIEQTLALPQTFLSPMNPSSSVDTIVSGNQLPLSMQPTTTTPEQPGDANNSSLTVEVPYTSPYLFARTGCTVAEPPPAATQAAGALVVKSLGNLKFYASAADDFRFLLPRRLGYSTVVTSRMSKFDSGNANYTCPVLVYIWGSNLGIGATPIPLNYDAVMLY